MDQHHGRGAIQQDHDLPRDLLRIAHAVAGKRVGHPRLELLLVRSAGLDRGMAGRGRKLRDGVDRGMAGRGRKLRDGAQETAAAPVRRVG